MELLTTPCFTFFRIFLLSASFFTHLTVLRVNLSFFAFGEAFPLVSGSCPRKEMISVSCFQSFCSCSGESAIQDSFWRRLISCLKSAIGRWNIKCLEYMKEPKCFNPKKVLQNLTHSSSKIRFSSFE